MSKRIRLDPTLKQKTSSRLLQMRNKGAIIGLILSAVLFTTISDSPVCEIDGGTDTLVPFDCDSKLYVFQDSPTIFSTIGSDGNLESFGIASNCPNGEETLSLDGLGYRPADGLIYGISGDEDAISIYRIGAEGRVEHYADIEAPKGYTFNTNIGDISTQDEYFMHGNGDKNKEVLFTLDLGAVDQAIDQNKSMPELTVRKLASNLPDIHDWAYNPLDQMLYSIETDKGSVVEIDITQDPIKVKKNNANGNKMGTFGAVFFGSDGTLYTTQDNDGSNSRIYIVNYLDCPGQNCGDRTLLASGEAVSQGDGASCAAGLPGLSMSVSPVYALPGDTLTYTFTYSNPTITALTVENFTNQLPDELSDASFIANSLSGITTNIPYAESNTLTIENISVPARSGQTIGSKSFSIKTIVPQDASLYGKKPKSQASYRYQTGNYLSSDKLLPPGSKTPVNIPRPFSIEKKRKQGTPAPGNQLVYTVTLSNPVDGGDYEGAYQVNFRDTLKHATFVSGDLISTHTSDFDISNTETTFSSNTLSIDGIELLAGEEVIFEYTITVDEDFNTGEPLESSSYASVPNTNISTKATTEEASLPVEFMFFEVEERNGSAYLFWATASELNNDGFDIEHSTDGQNYESLGWVKGVGTTTEIQEYDFHVPVLSGGRHLFRLKQVDIDGQFDYSKQVELTLESEVASAKLNFFPNPFKGEGTLSIQIPVARILEINVINMAGVRVAQLHQGKLEGNQQYRFSFNGSQLPDGYYIIQASGIGFRQSQKILLRK